MIGARGRRLWLSTMIAVAAASMFAPARGLAQERGPQLARTRGTAAPTATALGIKPQVVAAAGPTHAQDVVTAVRAHAEKTVLVIGHSNTIPAIVEALGAKRPPAICDSQFDDFFIVAIVADGTADVTRASYGVRSPPDPRCATKR
jgi:hypothetical protein